MKKTIFLSLAFALVFAACDNVESLTKKGEEAFEQKDYAKAEELFNKAIEKDPAHAAVANRMLGIINSENLNETGTPKKALEYFMQATELGDSVAPYFVGQAYDQGKGTVQNFSNAIKYYTMSADAGYPQAQAIAGWLYLAGYNSAEVNQEKGVAYLQEAVEAGNYDAMAYLGSAYEFGDGGISKDETKALELYSQSAEGGSPDGKAILGLTYAYGYLGVNPNITKGEQLIRESIEEGSTLGMRYLGGLYRDKKILAEDGNGNDLNAINWYRKAAEAGNVDAMQNLGREIMDTSYGNKEKQAEGMQWLQRAAEQGSSDAMVNLGYYYEKGKGVKQSWDKAFEWYLKGAEAGDEVGQYDVALCYEYGRGTTKNLQKAIEWYRKSADQGDEDAQKALKRLGVK
ncbi:MAG: SEL1-like repeat protein [Muribaculaceae bacterium]|nr:SEL1-like repeat protein [Muribaculaceae bacterium]